jgi:hypothetical protein
MIALFFVQLKSNHQKIIFPLSFINPVSEVAVERHIKIYPDKGTGIVYVN